MNFRIFVSSCVGNPLSLFCGEINNKKKDLYDIVLIGLGEKSLIKLVWELLRFSDKKISPLINFPIIKKCNSSKWK